MQRPSTPPTLLFNDAIHQPQAAGADELFDDDESALNAPDSPMQLIPLDSALTRTTSPPPPQYTRATPPPLSSPTPMTSPPVHKRVAEPLATMDALPSQKSR